MSRKQTVLTQQDKNEMLSHSPFVLPDNPSSKQMSANQIRRKMYEAYVVLFDWLSRAIVEHNNGIDDVDTAIALLNSYFTSGKANKAIADEDNNNIKATYGASVTGNTVTGGGNQKIEIHLYNKNGQEIGTTAVITLKEVKTDGTAYAGLIAPADKTKIDNCPNNTNSVLNALQDAIDDEAVTRGSADTSLGNAITAETANRILAVSAETSRATGVENTKVNISDVKNDLTSNDTDKPLSAYQGKVLNGLIENINTLLASDDTSLDELQEIVTYIKNNKSLIDGITISKVNVSDIVDNVTTNNASKVLSAKQGKVLKDLIDALTTLVGTKANSNDVYTKTNTYNRTEVDTKMLGAGLINVTEYDDETGNLTIEYQSGAVTPSYDATTGILTLTY